MGSGPGGPGPAGKMGRGAGENMGRGVGPGRAGCLKKWAGVWKERTVGRGRAGRGAAVGGGRRREVGAEGASWAAETEFSAMLPGRALGCRGSVAGAGAGGPAGAAGPAPKLTKGPWARWGAEGLVWAGRAG